MTTPEQATQRAGSAQPEAIYMVVAGDSLSKIAQRFYGDAQQFPRIAQANGLDPSAALQIGQRLRIPGASVAQQPHSATPPTAPVASVPTPATQVVQPGFTALSLSDWRVWAGVGLVGLAFYLLSRKSTRK